MTVFSLVPTLCVGMPSPTLCVPAWTEQTLDRDTKNVVPSVLAHPAERGKTGSHAERGNQR